MKRKRSSKYSIPNELVDLAAREVICNEPATPYCLLDSKQLAELHDRIANTLKNLLWDRNLHTTSSITTHDLANEVRDAVSTISAAESLAVVHLTSLQWQVSQAVCFL
jgi:hypothetical protein